MRTKDQILKGMPMDAFMAQARMSCPFFIKNVLGLDESNKGFSLQPFHIEWINALRDNSRVIIKAPRGHGKTTIMGICIPLWLASMSPRKSFEALAISYSQDQSRKIIKEIKYNVMENQILKKLMPRNKTEETWTADALEFTNKNKITAVPFTEKAAGEHVNYLLCDEISRFKNQDLFFDVFEPTYTFKRGKIVGIGTPVSEIDLLAKLSRNVERGISERGYRVLNYCAITDLEKFKTIKEALKFGTPLWPEKWGLKELREKYKAMGPGKFNSQFLCKIENIEEEYFNVNNLLKSADSNLTFQDKCYGIGFMGADFALSASRTGDHSVFIILDKVEEKVYLRYGIRMPKGTPIPMQEFKIREIYEKYRPAQVWIDETNCGAAFKGLIQFGLPIIGQHFHPTARALMLSNLKRTIDMGNLVLPMSEKDSETYEFVQRLIHELRGFREQRKHGATVPRIFSVVDHDDVIMALALALKGFSEVSASDGEVLYSKEKVF